MKSWKKYFRNFQKLKCENTCQKNLLRKKAREKCRIIQEVMQIKKENESEDQKLTT